MAVKPGPFVSNYPQSVGLQKVSALAVIFLIRLDLILIGALRGAHVVPS